MKPESLMMSHGFKPELSEGAIKPPIFQTSTFVFKTAEEGKNFFEVAYGLRDQEQEEELGLIYSRINNPNLEILEDRLCLWDRADACAVFESGMSAISTVLLEFLKPGDLLLYSMPTYGGTDHFINHYLKSTGIDSIGFLPGTPKATLIQMIKESGKADRLRMIYLETPANPTNDLIDISMCKEVADYFSKQEKVHVAVDNTYMGPLWSHPLDHGADLVLYSATKYIGGHSDLIAGAVLGNDEYIGRVKVLRTFLGNMASPHTCWLLMRSLETLKVRMEQQAYNAQCIADFLSTQSLVKKVHYLGHLDQTSTDYSIYQRQYLSPGAMISFEIEGGQKAAFEFMNQLKLIKLAVSLGSTESLIQHPATMTHVGVDADLKMKLGINDDLIRLSVGVEHFEDLINDMTAAFELVTTNETELMATY
ncbi:MAG: cystathionine gamma-synthase family protein [Cytophagales bacterium]|nr:cystathionine gamma-synthase family protein [Cytophagales bacterium]